MPSLLLNVNYHFCKDLGTKPCQTENGLHEDRLQVTLTLSSIYTHFNKLKKKASGKHCGKR